MTCDATSLLAFMTLRLRLNVTLRHVINKQQKWLWVSLAAPKLLVLFFE